MPLAPEVRGLGNRWQGLQSRVSAYMASAPSDGVPLWKFEEQCLPWVAPEDRPAIVKALRGKRLIFPVRNGAVVRIFPALPESRRFEPAADVALEQFLRAVAPHMNRIAEIVAARDGQGSRESRSIEAEACRLLAAIMQRHFDKGLALAPARDALWRTYHPAVMAVVGRRELILMPDSRVTAVAPRKVKAKKARANADIEERVVGLVERAGREGITKTDLGRSLGKSRPLVADFDAMIVSLKNSGLLQTGIMKLTRFGRPGFRLFSAQIRMPRVTSNGVAAFD